MKSVFVLQHSYEVDSYEETKFIGVYTSEEEANCAIERLKQQPGFCDRPDDFCISEYELNKDDWTEGFATMTTIYVKDINDKWMCVAAKELIDGTYQIIEYYTPELLGEFKNQDIVKCEKRRKKLYATELIIKA